MKIRHVAFAALAAASSAAIAQTPAPVPAVQQTAPAPEAAPPAAAVLPANSEVTLTLNEELNSESHHLGDKFSLTVAQDVKVSGSTVIPKGTRAVGLITMRKGRGSFGKSGKLDFDLKYVDLDGRRIPIEGHNHHEGAGNGAAAVGAVLGAGIVGGLIVHGKSAKVPSGREFTAHTLEPVPVALPATAGQAALVMASYTPTPVRMDVMTDKERKAAEKAMKASQKH